MVVTYMKKEINSKKPVKYDKIINYYCKLGKL